ncbi:MAG: peptidoglycan-associated lipoprotein Pal [Bdellovibrionales bacterium]|nr:peptidoglycan-associated lipoprotein Pal [Bdellovibrionales bacterium]
MRAVRFLGVLLLVVTMAACSKSSKSGSGMADDSGMGEGNIPMASEGSADLPDINFEYDSSALSSRAQSLLSANAKWLMNNKDKKIVLEGHCDERGTREYNMALGERRARAAYDYLRSLGISSQQLSTISYGEELPLDTGSSEMAWSKNRRVHFATR